MPVDIEGIVYYTVTEISEKEKVSRTYILRLIKFGKITTKQSPLGHLISDSDLISWLSSRRPRGRPNMK